MFGSQIPDSRFQIPDSKIRRFEDSKIQNSKSPRVQDSRFQDFKISRFQDFGFKDSGSNSFLNIQRFNLLDVQNSTSAKFILSTLFSRLLNLESGIWNSSSIVSRLFNFENEVKPHELQKI
jgi:hypothetical protein